MNRGIVRADMDVREGQVWRDGTIPYQRFRAWELAGQTVGHRRARAPSAARRSGASRVSACGSSAHDPFAPDATHSLDDLLAEADVVSTARGRHTRDATASSAPRSSRAMKEGAIYINSARAQLHDTDALVIALQSGKLAGAGLDHFVGEHLAVDHPLCSMPNVVLTPHIGGATWDTEARHSQLIADGLATCSPAAVRPTW